MTHILLGFLLSLFTIVCLTKLADAGGTRPPATDRHDAG
jgi:hypothetical protein